MFVLGYWAYLDSQNKKHQELMRIIQEAEKNLQTIERNPNRVSHSNLASYTLQNYLSDKKFFLVKTVVVICFKKDCHWSYLFINFDHVAIESVKLI